MLARSLLLVMTGFAASLPAQPGWRPGRVAADRWGPGPAFTIAVEFHLESHREPQVLVTRGARGEQFTLYVYKKALRWLVEHEAPNYAFVTLPLPTLDRNHTAIASYDGTTLSLQCEGRSTSKALKGALAASETDVCIGARDPGIDRLDGAISRVDFWNASEPAAAPPDHSCRFVNGAWRGATRMDGAVLPSLRGYRGIWYFNQPTKDEHVYKYSGGFATYPQQHVPIAIYDRRAHKTFFAFGCVSPGGSLVHAIGELDHETFTVSRPRVLLDKNTTDAHDNPTLAVDGDGRLTVFSNSHGTARPSYVHRSGTPGGLDRFDLLRTTNFSYGQPWWIDGHGYCFLHTLYRDGRRMLHVSRSRDGVAWDEPRAFAGMDRGHYQISWPDGPRLGTAFNRHPEDGGLNSRTDLHWAETHDGGATWTDIDGAELELPLSRPEGSTLVAAFAEEGRNVYLKDISYEADGSPLILFATTSSWRPGPEGGPRRLHVARRDAGRWTIQDGPEIDHAYDHGSLLIDGNAWRLVAPTGPGPEPWLTGGEVEEWRSTDRGVSWRRVRSLTPSPRRHHTYVRKVLNAHPDCEVVWADGDPTKESTSSIYFASRDGGVYRLPYTMPRERGLPELQTR